MTKRQNIKPYSVTLFPPLTLNSLRIVAEKEDDRRPIFARDKGSRKKKKKKKKKMGARKKRGNCAAIRPLPLPSIYRPSSNGSTSPDDTIGSPPKWIGRGLSCVCINVKGRSGCFFTNLTPLQEDRLQRLKNRMAINFDSSRDDHQEALKDLWVATYPDKELHGLISEQWKQMGWQGTDPSTDFRGAGFISLENLLFFAKSFTASFQRLLNKQGGKRATWEYPFAVAGVNITFMIMQMLDFDSSKPRTFVKAVLLQVFAEDEWAFDMLYCVAFMVMDKQWLEKNASYMEFNDVLRSTRAQLERELLFDDVSRIVDMPSFSLLL